MVDLSAVTGTVGSLLSQLPTSSDIATQLVTGAIATTLLAGANTQQGQNALDPLHLFHQNAQGTTVVGKSITMSVFNGLSAAAQASVLASGYAIVAG